MPQVFDCKPGETYFCTSDIGWVVGHSYIIYGPLINGSTTIMYDGLPIRPDAGIWWKIVQDNKVSVMFTSPTAARVLKKQDQAFLKKYDISSLRSLFLAGEPLDEPTARWLDDALTGVDIIDNYWQTETGWPMLSASLGIENTPRKFGSPSFPTAGFNVKVINEGTGEEAKADEKGVLVVVPPLPPGCLATVWGDDDRFVKTYFSGFKRQLYSSFDWAIRDKDGYHYILGRTDDVINVAGHRLGTREIEEAISAHSNIAECAVVGVADQLKGQIPLAFAVVKDVSKVATAELAAQMEKEVMATVDKQLGAIARPARVHFVTLLPKTRSGKLLRRSIQALAEGRDPGDLTTLDDPSALEQIKVAVTK
jgi:propionyl-CoA synthetase